MPVASLAAVNLAPGRAAPDGSTTMPSMAPWFPWGHADGESSEKARKNAREQYRRAVRVSEIFTAVSPSECGRNFLPPGPHPSRSGADRGLKRRAGHHARAERLQQQDSTLSFGVKF